MRGDRRLSFAEYGSPRGPAIIWMHGTPGARRQIPIEARAYADAHDLRIVGVDRPGIGSSTPYLYPSIADWTADLECLLDALAIDTCRLIGLSGGGPYVLAAGALLPDRVHGVGVLGGVVPTRGDGRRGGRHHPARRPDRAAPHAGPGAARDRAHPGDPAHQAAGRSGARPVRR